MFSLQSLPLSLNRIREEYSTNTVLSREISSTLGVALGYSLYNNRGRISTPLTSVLEQFPVCNILHLDV